MSPAAPHQSASPSLEIDEDDGYYWGTQVFEAEIVPSYRKINKPIDDQAQVQANIRAAYESRTPFFTKEAIRQVVQCFDRIHAGSKETVSITGLNGVPVEFCLQTGEVKEGYINEPDIEYLLTLPILRYRSFEDLTWVPEYEGIYFDPATAYLTMSVIHYSQRLNKHTKQVIYGGGQEPATHEHLAPIFQSRRQLWQTTDAFRVIQSLFTGQPGMPPLPSLPPITKVVALSCASMAFDNDFRPRSAAQHALALSIRDLLVARNGGGGGGGGGGREVKCYAQDPVYRPVDKSVLREHGVEVLEDPRAFLEIDEGTVLVAVASDIPVRQIVAELARPAVIVWDRVTDEVEEGRMTDPVSPRVREMIRTDYVELEFPRDKDHFTDVAMYVRVPCSRT